VEPYVAAADVYAVEPHAGRGGWSWYTGSAGWMYRLIVESLLGLARENNRLRFAPRLPADWSGFNMRYRYFGTDYEIEVRRVQANAPGAPRVTLDGIAQHDGSVPLADDHQEHRVTIEV
jgi:cellobiose phosphorylase